MDRKRILPLVLLISLALPAFRLPIRSRPQLAAKLAYQDLSIIHPDGSAEFQYILKVRQVDVQVLTGPGGKSEKQMCLNLADDMQTKTGTFSQEQHGEDLWCKVTFELRNLKALQTLWETEIQGLTVNRLEIKSGTFYLDISWSNLPCRSNDPTMLTCEFEVQTPGKPGANNAARVEDNTLIWNMVGTGDSANFTAQSAAGGGMSTAIAIVVFLMCCCLVILLIAAGVAAVLILRRRKASPAEPKSGEPPVPAGPAGPVALP